MKTQQLQFRTCLGCGKTSKECSVLVALPGPQYICQECIILLVAIVADGASVELRIRFVEEMVAVLREPMEIVTKWKEARAKSDDSTGERS
jgi:hypothetical protein